MEIGDICDEQKLPTENLFINPINLEHNKDSFYLSQSLKKKKVVEE